MNTRIITVIACAAIVATTMVGAQTKGSSVLAPSAPVLKELDRLEHGKRHGHAGVSAVFLLDGERVQVEARRGRRTHDRHEGGPRYEVDVCILDDAGRPLVAQYGGDESMIPECESEDGPTGIDAHPAVQAFGMPVDRKGSFKRAEKAVKLIRKAGFRRKFQPEFEAIVGQLGLLAEGRRGKKALHADTLIRTESGVEPMSKEFALGDVVPAPQNHPTGYQHYIEIHSSSVRGTGGHAAHGATVAYRIPHCGAINFAWSRCNHGRCYYLMPWKCSLYSPANRVSHVHVTTCGTYYNPFSTLGGHNCNDDTFVEYLSVRNNAHFDRYGGTCSDPFRADYTTNCF